MPNQLDLSAHTTPEQLARHLGVSERLVRSWARDLGARCILGKRMLLLADHVPMILEAT